PRLADRLVDQVERFRAVPTLIGCRGLELVPGVIQVIHGRLHVRLCRDGLTGNVPSCQAAGEGEITSELLRAGIQLRFLLGYFPFPALMPAWVSSMAWLTRSSALARCPPLSASAAWSSLFAMFRWFSALFMCG